MSLAKDGSGCPPKILPTRLVAAVELAEGANRWGRLRMASLAMVIPTTKMSRRVGRDRSSAGASQAAAPWQVLPAVALTRYQARPPSWQSLQANSAGAEAAMGTLHALLRWAGTMTGGSPGRSHHKPWTALLCSMVGGH